MAMEGTLKSRNGKLYVRYTSDEYSEPYRQYLWWRVLETRGTGYGERPEAEDIAISIGGGGWQTRNPSTHRSTGSVSTGTGSTQAELVERVSINPPPAGGKELRWRDGRWEKLMAKGWMPAGEGKAKTSTKTSTKTSKRASTHHATKKKSPAQLDREIAETLHATKKPLSGGAAKGLPWIGHPQARRRDYSNASPTQVKDKLGTDHVEWILRQPHPAATARGRARGEWDANNLETMSAYERLADLIDAGRIVRNGHSTRKTKTDHARPHATVRKYPWHVETFYRGDWQRSGDYRSKAAATRAALQRNVESGLPTSVVSSSGQVVWFSKP